MRARYLIRLDDASHHMHRARWARVEAVLDAHHVKPIVAVIPDNRDGKLMLNEPDADFWARVRAWRTKGWTVAMHGYQHLMHVTRARLLLPFYARSEFAGLTLEEQRQKVRESWKLFVAQGVQPAVWVAPAHSFDELTLQALLSETPIRIVSDGIALDTYFEHGFHWVPQQLWQLSERPAGLWTVCLHPNTMTESAIEALDQALAQRFASRLLSLGEVRLRQRPRTWLDGIYGRYFWWRRARAQRN